MWEAIMLYTVKDKSKFSLVFFLIALFIYVSYIFYDYNNQRNSWREDFGLRKQESVSQISPNALLLGGSNVAYSLSANQLSKMTEYSWYNLGLSSEAFSDENYWGFVSSTLNDKQRLGVELVVYSGIIPLRVGHLSSRENDNSDSWGNRKISWTPNRPLANRLKNSFRELDDERGYPLPLSRGDFDFKKMRCDANYIEAFEREMNWEQVQSWVEAQISIITDKFPNASVIFVTPSEFYGNTYNRNADISSTTRLRSLIQSKFGANVSFLAQPPYTDKSITCDGRHHANSVGRAWRTENLLDFINSRID